MRVATCGTVSPGRIEVQKSGCATTLCAAPTANSSGSSTHRARKFIETAELIRFVQVKGSDPGDRRVRGQTLVMGRLKVLSRVVTGV
jgi:hypothetical protein